MRVKTHIVYGQLAADACLETPRAIVTQPPRETSQVGTCISLNDVLSRAAQARQMTSEPAI
jgi:hypothetical protein